jgi:hypothetical protein
MPTSYEIAFRVRRAPLWSGKPDNVSPPLCDSPDRGGEDSNTGHGQRVEVNAWPCASRLLIGAAEGVECFLAGFVQCPDRIECGRLEQFAHAAVHTGQNQLAATLFGNQV